MSSPARSRRRRQLRALSACPDCSADVRVISDDAQLPRVRVAHDATCPTFQRANGGVRYTQFRLLEVDR